VLDEAPDQPSDGLFEPVLFRFGQILKLAALRSLPSSRGVTLGRRQLAKLPENVHIDVNADSAIAVIDPPY